MKRFLLFAVVLASCSQPTRERVAESRAKSTRSVHPMLESRGHNACVELPLGKGPVMIASDIAGGGYSNTAEILDPSAGTWSYTAGKMTQGRWDHSAALLPSGKVLVAGGYADDKSPQELSSAEIFDPATGTFTSTGSMTDTRKLFALVVPKDGKPLAIGGVGYMAPVISVERFDPSTNTWTTIAPLNNIHSPTQAVVMADGTSVMVTGSIDSPPEIFDGTKWTATAAQAYFNEVATLTLLDDGRVLATGGDEGGPVTARAQVYDPKTKAWKEVGSMAHVRVGHSAVKVSSGLVMVAGGSPSGDVEAFDPSTNTFSVVGFLATPRDSACATTYGAGAIFAGGALPGSGNVYIPTVDVWEPSAPLETCKLDAECVTGKCVMGQCALLGDGGVGDSGLPPSDGGFDAQPSGAPPVTPGTFQHCAKNSECSTGHCVEGVCCDTACDQTCHSCVLPSSPGKCSPEPVGVDLKGECGAALSCTGTCGPEQKCIGSGPGAQCAKSRCTSASAGVGAATCTAAGAACPTEQAVPFDCGAYACEPAFGACLSSCSSSADCAGGYVCDTASKTCAASAPSGDSGGCTYGKSATNGLPLAALLLLSWMGRRKIRPE
ncbi:MAG: Kelch repeat-containing protein [Polyangiales bacterium]